MCEEATRAEGTREHPWSLKTPSGQSEYEAWRDETLDSPALVVQVGKSQLRYHPSAVDDVHAMLEARDEWTSLWSADEQKPAADGTVTDRRAHGQPRRPLPPRSAGPEAARL